MPETVEKKQNWFMRHKFWTAVIVIFVIIGINNTDKSSSSSSAPTTTTTTNSPSAPELKKEDAKPEKKMPSLNEVVQVGDMAFTALKVTESKSLGSSYSKKEPQGIFRIVTLKVENKGKETKLVDSSMIKLKDDQDRTFERSVEGQTAKGFEKGSLDMFLKQVQPGLNIIGEVVFDIPTDAKGLKLQVSSGLFSTPTEISLGQ